MDATTIYISAMNIRSSSTSRAPAYAGAHYMTMTIKDDNVDVTYPKVA